ncbi:Hypothetical predicted protein [Xyrichtys novacula]|uniref:Uncharacterized protein n=1 Tax=Xyrichtys novacula TaxID=13765 RepID=A0AAV1EUV8_XYRNO|nr:Hypothetical predicted protein [Xyrichtys novacula]
MCCVYSSQYIVFSLTARHSGELRINPPKRAAAPDRTNHSDGSDDSRRSSHIMAAILQITDSGPRIKRVLKTNEGVVRTKSERRHSVHMDPPTATSYTNSEEGKEEEEEEEGRQRGERERGGARRR